MPWSERAFDMGVFEKAFNVKLPVPLGDDIEYRFKMVECQKTINEFTGGCTVEPYVSSTLAPRIRDENFNGILTDEKSLEKLVFMEHTDECWDDLKRLVDIKDDYAMFTAISTGIGHIWQTMDITAFSIATIENPALLRTILERYTEWTCPPLEKNIKKTLDIISILS